MRIGGKQETWKRACLQGPCRLLLRCLCNQEETAQVWPSWKECKVEPEKGTRANPPIYHPLVTVIKLFEEQWRNSALILNVYPRLLSKAILNVTSKRHLLVKVGTAVSAFHDTNSFNSTLTTYYLILPSQFNSHRAAVEDGCLGVLWVSDYFYLNVFVVWYLQGYDPHNDINVRKSYVCQNNLVAP